MDMTLDMRIEAYLDGTLSPEETRAFEAELAAPAVSRAFSEALLIRTLFRSPVELPEGLVDRVAQAIGAAAAEETGAPEARQGTVRAVLGSLEWIVRGPAMAVPPRSGTGSATLSGLRTIRFALAPVNLLFAGKEKSEQQSPLKRWGRVLRRK
jgi:anti-sigma factor RsiW